jgi:hypothetical protein
VTAKRRQARRPTRLPRWQEWAVYISAILLILTGIAWLAFDWWVRVEGDFGPEHHPAEHWLLIAHGASAYLFLLVVGAMIPVHFLMGWRSRRNLVSGIGVASLCALLALSALGLYYVGEEVLRGWTSFIHWTVGLIFLPVLAVHIVNGWNSR